MTTLFRLLGVATIAFMIAAAFTPLTEHLSAWMARDGPVGTAAAIVVLGGGGVRGDGTLSDISLRRTLHGIRLYRQGAAPLLVLSGAPSRGRAEAELRAELAHESGVPPAAIVTVSEARTTHEEAVRIGALLVPKGIRRVIVVVDVEGTARAAGVFERAGFEVVPAGVADVARGGAPEERLRLLRRVLVEALARAYYHVAGYL